MLGMNLIAEYNPYMSSHQRMLNRERLSIVIATIMLAYTLVKIVNVPSRVIPIEFLGIYIPITINFKTIIILSVAGMTASGADWLLRDHPRLEEKSSLPHLLLPALTAWILSVILSNLPNDPLWWAVFTIGGIFLILVILAEFIVIDQKDTRRTFATTILGALSFAMFLALIVSLRSSNLRLVMTLPAVALSSGALSFRVIHLQNPNQKQLPEAIASLIIVTQLTAPLHYLPISPLSFGFVLLGTLYAAINFFVNISQNEFSRNSLLEPISVLIILWGLAIVLN
jgi:hypothetical protein